MRLPLRSGSILAAIDPLFTLDTASKRAKLNVSVRTISLVSLNYLLQQLKGFPISPDLASRTYAIISWFARMRLQIPNSPIRQC
jgi:hypothetical protein